MYKPHQPKQLTDKEAAFAAEHHDVVIAFLNARQLDQNEYYDIVVFAFLDSVQQFFRSNDVEFDSLAERFMHAACTDYDRTAENYPAALSLQTAEGVAALEEAYAETANAVDEVLYNITIEETLRACSVNEQKIIHMLLDGHKKIEIGEAMGLTPKALNLVMERIITKAATAA